MAITIHPKDKLVGRLAALPSDSFAILNRQYRGFVEWMKLQLQKQRLSIVYNPYPYAGTANVTDKWFSKVNNKLFAGYEGPWSQIKEVHLWDIQFEKLWRFVETKFILTQTQLELAVVAGDYTNISITAGVLAQAIAVLEDIVQPLLEFAQENQRLSPDSVMIIIEAYHVVIQVLAKLPNQDVSKYVWDMLLNVDSDKLFALKVFQDLAKEIEDRPELHNNRVVLEKKRHALNDLYFIFEGENAPQTNGAARYSATVRRFL
jgi:hypothetical protein